MNPQDVLHAIGVTEQSLSHDEKTFLDENGYLFLYDVMSPNQVDAFVARLEELEAAEGDDAGKEFHQEAGSARLSDLVNKDSIFEICFTHPRVVAAIAHVLENDFKLSSLNSRAALPGYGLQALHMDGGQEILGVPAVPVTRDESYFVCNSLWLLSDFNEENGATRLVPGSHRFRKHPKDALDDPAASHPNQILVTAPAGTVVIFNSHTWHGGTLNRSDTPRRAMHSYFCRREMKQQLNQKRYIRDETLARLGEAARYILDV
ncbi:MAG: phytanoyl-CoA dioxygenase family protein [Chloroflexota bacterium]